ncbi:MAG: hypothetical protein ACPG7F_05805, partial [Aggregatilineales bacterium]
MSDEYQIPTCAIEFRIRDMERYQVFSRFFKALKDWLQRPAPSLIEASSEDSTFQVRQYDKAEDWMLNFRPQDLELLGMPDHRTSISTLKAWRGLPRRERRNQIGDDAALQILADFSDMIKYFRDVDYDLVGC